MNSPGTGEFAAKAGEAPQTSEKTVEAWGKRGPSSLTCAVCARTVARVFDISGHDSTRGRFAVQVCLPCFKSGAGG